MKFANIFDTKNAANVFTFLIFVFYALIPFLINLFLFDDAYFFQLAEITAVASIFILIGFYIKIFDNFIKFGKRKLNLNESIFHICIWVFFVCFVIYSLATAPAIPIISSLNGATSGELSRQRGDIYKTRVGYEIILGYLGQLFVSIFLPFSIIRLIEHKSTFRYFLMLIFLVYSISFLQKSLFLYLFLPLMYYYIIVRKINLKNIIIFFVATFFLLYALAALAYAENANITTSSFNIKDFFQLGAYNGGGVLTTLFWRSVAIPIITAVDTLKVFQEDLHGNYLMGSTSSFISLIRGVNKIELEKMVASYQFGGWNDISNSNSVFVTEAFANFGFLGVTFLSLFVGLSLRFFFISKDNAFKSLWLSYCFALFSNGLIGVLLSGGFLIIFIFKCFFNLNYKK